ncbi:hypothetical protein QTP88_018352 [Uroleucon formosanum]
MVDFEYAIHKAIKIVWPKTEIIGCRFHLTQSWWRNVQKFGLATHYKDESSDIGKWIHYMFGLLFLNPEEVGDCYVEDLMSDCPENEKLQKFCDYLTDNYISKESMFPPKLWAAKSSELIRTTNACESFHSFFNKSFYSNSPPIHMWLAVVQEIQTDGYIKLNGIHLQHFPKDRQVRERQLKNEKTIEKYNRGELSRIYSDKEFQIIDEIDEGNCEDKENDCSRSVTLENEDEYNSDIESAEIDELLNMINAKA